MKAAYYLQKITRKHLFADGNKRTAFEAAKVFLILNGIKLHFEGIEAGQMFLDVTNSPASEEVMLKVAEYFKKHQVKLKVYTKGYYTSCNQRSAVPSFSLG